MAHDKLVLLIDRDVSDYTALPLTFCRALIKNGCEVKIVFFNVHIRLFRIVNALFPFLNQIFLAKQQRSVIQQIEESKVELVLVFKGFFLLNSTIDTLKRMGKKVVCYNPDDPFNTSFGSANRLIRSAIKSYDHYFIWSKQLIDPINASGCAKVHYIPFGVDNTIIKPANANGEQTVKQDIDVSFIGGGDDKRITFIRELRTLLNKEISISVFGDSWPEISGVVVHGAVGAEDYLEVMYSSKISLNILRVQNEGSNNMRTFEIPATRGFMLHEHSKEAEVFFEKDKEAGYFDNVEECAELIVKYLSSDDSRNEIAQAGYRKIYDSGYLYEDRMVEMMKIINGPMN